MTERPHVSVTKTGEDGKPVADADANVTVEQTTGVGQPEYLRDDRVNLAALISDEFGVSPIIAREQIALGMVEIDGVEQAERGKIEYSVAEIDGKVISVLGRDRQFKLTYDHDRHMARKESFR